jgi:hypothetical protein
MEAQMTHSAHVELTRVNKAGQVEGLALSVHYGPNEARIEIHLGQPLPGETPQIPTVALQLRELGVALLHIADNQSAIIARPDHRS